MHHEGQRGALVKASVSRRRPGALEGRVRRAARSIGPAAAEDCRPSTRVGRSLCRVRKAAQSGLHAEAAFGPHAATNCSALATCGPPNWHLIRRRRTGSSRGWPGGPPGRSRCLRRAAAFGPCRGRIERRGPRRRRLRKGGRCDSPAEGAWGLVRRGGNGAPLPLTPWADLPSMRFGISGGGCNRGGQERNLLGDLG
jgi:hypothetical protein